MDIEIRHTQNGTHKVDSNLYSRGDCFGIDFNNCKSQILIRGVTETGCRQMIREIIAYTVGNYENEKIRAALDNLFDEIKKAKG